MRYLSKSLSVDVQVPSSLRSLNMALITEDKFHQVGETSNEDFKKVSGSDWLSNLIATSKLVITAGDVIAIPHVRWAASAVLFLLESIQVCFFFLLNPTFINPHPTQQIKQNKSRYRELAENVVTLLSILSNTKSSEGEGDLLKHAAICSTFRT